MILPIRSRRSLRSLATARMAMISEDTAMAKPDSITMPSSRPPRPMTMLRSDWAQKSRIQRTSTRLGSISNRLRFFLARNSSVLFCSCCILEVRATIIRLWAFMMLSISPVSPRENGVKGMVWARPPPAAEPLILKVGPPEGWRIAPTTFLPISPRP